MWNHLELNDLPNYLHSSWVFFANSMKSVSIYHTTEKKHWILLWFHTKIRCVHELIENLLTRYNNLSNKKKQASKQAVKIWVSIQHFKVKVIKFYWRLEPPNAYWFMLHLTFKVTACHTVVHLTVITFYFYKIDILYYQRYNKNNKLKFWL